MIGNDERLFESERAVADFAAALKTNRIGKRLHYFHTTASTNDLALQAARSGAPDGTVFIAEVQKSGRGRRGRTWESPPGRGLLFSIVVDATQFAAARLSWIPMAAGLACVEGFAQTTPVEATIKWPNDIVVPASSVPGWRKLGGILCESFLASRSGERSAVIAGIGLNINHSETELPAHAKAPPSSVRLECGTHADREKVFAAVLESFEKQLDQLRTDAGTRALHGATEDAMCRWWGSRTLDVQTVVDEREGETGVLAGRFAGLNEAGWLRLTLKDGREQSLADAEVLAVR